MLNDSQAISCYAWVLSGRCTLARCRTGRIYQTNAAVSQSAVTSRDDRGDMRGARSHGDSSAIAAANGLGRGRRRVAGAANSGQVRGENAALARSAVHVDAAVVAGHNPVG